MEGRSARVDLGLTQRALGETDAWSFVIAELRCLPLLTENCSQVSESKRFSRREKLAINIVMGMNMFIKLKCRKRRLADRG